ncbi:MAG: MBL fold metallo-hydrolase RNA specificity domain-containing protein [Armatimonadota bacterium]
MILSFEGAVRTVTGSCFVLETPQGLLMVDRGLYQGNRRLRERNWADPPCDLSQVRWLLLTHAHIDHSGLIPRLRHHGFQGEIWATEATTDLCRIMLADSGHIQEEDAKFDEKRWRKRGREGPRPRPLYTIADAEAIMASFRPVRYDERVTLGDGVRCCFRDGGHILGSAIIELWMEDGSSDTKLVFSGDLGQPRRPILRDPALIEEADVVVIESTYGNRRHEDVEARPERLLGVLEPALQQGGHVLIPSFAVERTQELIYTLNDLVEGGELRPVPTFIDSPLAVNATRVFRKHPECYDAAANQRLARGDDPFQFPLLKLTHSVAESKRINEIQEPCVIISASGMCTAGRVRHHLRNHLGHQQDVVLFVGFQAEGTLGRKLRDGAEYVKLFGERRRVRAQVAALDGFSAHADQEGLLKWLQAFERPPQAVFVVHGEEQASLTFAHHVADRLRVPAYVPVLGEAVDLADVEAVAATAREQYQLAAPKITAEAEPAAVAIGEAPEEADVQGEEEEFGLWEALAREVEGLLGG